MSDYLDLLGKNAKQSAVLQNVMGQNEKNAVLLSAADRLESEAEWILAANHEDLNAAQEKGMKEALLDRLTLTAERIHAMAEGCRTVAALKDPIGEYLSMTTRPNGLIIGQKRVPLGVIGIIYEARPNVTADAFALCFKTGNAVILRGGSDALHSNHAIAECIRRAIAKCGADPNALQLIEESSREYVQEFMTRNDFLDLLIPRGGAGLIRSCMEHATVPVIQTGTGNCHIYVDEYADYEKAIPIIINAKTQRLGVCNACESLVIHSAAAPSFLPLICDALREKQVEIRGCERCLEIVPDLVPATEEDYGREYLDAIISVKIVDSIEEAIAHINRYNTKHSEAIITEHYGNAMKFLNEIDAAAVYVNASTRFTDGGEFGFGAEIGISTQKLHARGPMGLTALTTTKYTIFGNGQIRP